MLIYQIQIGDDIAKLQEDIARLTSENGELKIKHDETLDKYRRSIAENDNMRKRLTKQIEDAKIFGIQGNLIVRFIFFILITVGQLTTRAPT